MDVAFTCPTFTLWQEVVCFWLHFHKETKPSHMAVMHEVSGWMIWRTFWVNGCLIM